MITNRNKVIQDLAVNEGMTIAQIARLIGKSPANLYDIKTGKVKGVSNKLANKILEAFPRYSRTWLVTGEGDMLVPEDNFKSEGDMSLGVSLDNINEDNALKIAIKAMSDAHANMAKMLEQMDRLLNVIENLSSK